MKELKELIKIADIHASRIQMVLNDLSYCLPFNETKITNLTKQELLLTDLLVNRFGKLQDLLGNKIINLFLIVLDEYEDHLTTIDKLNKLERFLIIENSTLWQEMRKARNHAAHEYPDNPNLTSLYLNDIVKFAPQLITILDNIKIRINIIHN